MSRRPLLSERLPSEVLPYQYDEVPNSFRVQLTYIIAGMYRAICRGDRYAADTSRQVVSYGPDQLWAQIRNGLRLEFGLQELYAGSNAAYVHAQDEVCGFLIEEADAKQVLDAVDYIFHFRPKTAYPPGAAAVGSDAIKDLNERFAQNHLGYRFTDEQLVRIDSDYVHKEITEPAALLLRTPGFETAHQEF